MSRPFVDSTDLILQRALPRNFVVNVLDGGFFALGLSFSSLVTILPLFVSRLTDSPLAIGLIPAFWNMGWLFPQLFTANYVQHLPRKKPMVLLVSLGERVPYILIAALALALPQVGAGPGLAAFFAILSVITLAGGFTATAWQEMIAKIIPPRRRGTFFGTQNFVGGLLGAVGAAVAGQILGLYTYPVNFAVCFGLTFVAMHISFAFLAATVEPAVPAHVERLPQREYLRQLPVVLRADPNFARFLLARAVAILGMLGSGFLTVHAAARLGAGPAELGIFTSASMAAQTVANLVLGVWGDRVGHKRMLELAGVCMAGAMAGGWLAGTGPAFLLAYVLLGVATAGNLVSALAITLEFGPPDRRPTYIGLANTAQGPFAGAAPILGGWLAGSAGYPAMFALGTVLSLLGSGLLALAVREPRHTPQAGETHA